ncbi:hypothetical protein DFH09DRAFT_1310431 [Mycena vulgaris]|nr:hypothetical protein DFH09DRAFT_1310431 [Mycena vulgaris]
MALLPTLPRCDGAKPAGRQPGGVQPARVHASPPPSCTRVRVRVRRVRPLSYAADDPAPIRHCTCAHPPTTAPCVRTAAEYRMREKLANKTDTADRARTIDTCSPAGQGDDEDSSRYIPSAMHPFLSSAAPSSTYSLCKPNTHQFQKAKYGRNAHLHPSSLVITALTARSTSVPPHTHVHRSTMRALSSLRTRPACSQRDITVAAYHD